MHEHTYNDLEKMATAAAKSGMFGGIKNVEQGVSLMLLALAEGRHPAAGLADYHVVQGRPAMKADTMLARFQASGGKVEWTKYEDTAVSAVFSHPSGGSAAIEWTIKRAQEAKLTDKAVWKQYPRALLRARVISEGVRTVYPGVAPGIYTPEEINDFAPTNKETSEKVQSGPSVEAKADSKTVAEKPQVVAGKQQGGRAQATSAGGKKPQAKPAATKASPKDEREGETIEHAIDRLTSTKEGYKKLAKLICDAYGVVVMDQLPDSKRVEAIARLEAYVNKAKTTG